MNKKFLELLKTRRSIRAFKSEQIDGGELDAILEAGTWAPTGRGAQVPVIIAVQNPDVIKKLSAMNAKVWGKDVDPYYGAPTVVLVLADTVRPTYIEDASCVLENMMLAAHALGVGSCWIHREKEMFASPEGKALLKEWGVSGDLVGVGALSLGYAAKEAPAPAPRKADYIVKVK